MAFPKDVLVFKKGEKEIAKVIVDNKNAYHFMVSTEKDDVIEWTNVGSAFACVGGVKITNDSNVSANDVVKVMMPLPTSEASKRGVNFLEFYDGKSVSLGENKEFVRINETNFYDELEISDLALAKELALKTQDNFVDIADCSIGDFNFVASKQGVLSAEMTREQWNALEDLKVERFERGKNKGEVKSACGRYETDKYLFYVGPSASYCIYHEKKKGEDPNKLEFKFVFKASQVEASTVAGSASKVFALNLTGNYGRSWKGVNQIANITYEDATSGTSADPKKTEDVRDALKFLSNIKTIEAKKNVNIATKAVKEKLKDDSAKTKSAVAGASETSDTAASMGIISASADAAGTATTSKVKEDKVMDLIKDNAANYAEIQSIKRFGNLNKNLTEMYFVAVTDPKNDANTSLAVVDRKTLNLMLAEDLDFQAGTKAFDLNTTLPDTLAAEVQKDANFRINTNKKVVSTSVTAPTWKDFLAVKALRDFHNSEKTDKYTMNIVSGMVEPYTDKKQGEFLQFKLYENGPFRFSAKAEESTYQWLYTSPILGRSKLKGHDYALAETTAHTSKSSNRIRTLSSANRSPFVKGIIKATEAVVLAGVVVAIWVSSFNLNLSKEAQQRYAEEAAEMRDRVAQYTLVVDCDNAALAGYNAYGMVTEGNASWASLNNDTFIQSQLESTLSEIGKVYTTDAARNKADFLSGVGEKLGEMAAAEAKETDDYTQETIGGVTSTVMTYIVSDSGERASGTGARVAMINYVAQKLGVSTEATTVVEKMVPVYDKSRKIVDYKEPTVYQKTDGTYVNKDGTAFNGTVPAEENPVTNWYFENGLAEAVVSAYEKSYDATISKSSSTIKVNNKDDLSTIWTDSALVAAVQNKTGDTSSEIKYCDGNVLFAVGENCVHKITLPNGTKLETTDDKDSFVAAIESADSTCESAQSASDFFGDYGTSTDISVEEVQEQIKDAAKTIFGTEGQLYVSCGQRQTDSSAKKFYYAPTLYYLAQDGSVYMLSGGKVTYSPGTSLNKQQSAMIALAGEPSRSGNSSAGYDRTAETLTIYQASANKVASTYASASSGAKKSARKTSTTSLSSDEISSAEYKSYQATGKAKVTRGSQFNAVKNLTNSQKSYTNRTR